MLLIKDSVLLWQVVRKQETMKLLKWILSTLVLITMQLFYPVLFFQALLLLFDLSTQRACLSKMELTFNVLK